MADPKYVQDFIAEITPYAVAVGDQFGIDPVTIITQAAVETGWGREVAGNNYFGVKSHGKPGGQNITTHEEVGGKRVRTTDNFRTYGSLGESVADYGRFLSENPRYSEALKLTGPDQLQAIAKAGYATDSNYADLTRNVAGMVQRNMRPLPPGSLPEVATLQDTRRTPALPPVPVTSSPDMAMMRRAAAPSQLIRDSFAQLPRPGGNNAGDSLAMRPVQGGRQQAPMFDAAYDERVGAMRQTRQPIDSQGMATGSSRAPAPVPASPYDRVTARLNNLPPVSRLPEVPPPAVGGPPTTRAVQSVPMVAPRMQVSASDMARGRNGWETIASIPSTSAAQSVPVRGNVPSGGFAGQERAPSVPDRLPALPRLDVASLYGAGASDFNPYGAPIPAPLDVAPLSPNNALPSPIQIASGTGFRGASQLMPPMPVPRPSFMPAVGTSLSVRPMPPMPIARPQIAQQRRAPVPMPLAMRPAQQRAPLRIVVQRDQPVQQQPKPTPQGFTDNGGGSLVSNEYGSTYYSRHL